jgi:hypothetical protein
MHTRLLSGSCLVTTANVINFFLMKENGVFLSKGEEGIFHEI